MAQWLDATQPGFESRFKTLLDAKRESSLDVSGAVAAIIADVRARGDAALREFTLRFDAFDLGQESLAIPQEEFSSARDRCRPGEIAALEHAHRRIVSFHERHKPHDDWYTDKAGVGLGVRWRAVASAGLYVPGGKAAYPSSMLMNAAPARIAGVARLAMVSPRPKGEANPLVLAAAHVCGVNEGYKIGGAQAIAALAYGTQTIAPVDKIVGPGNAYVAAAKRQVFGQVGIDAIAGPSEVVIVADGSCPPEWIAADLMAQAEHDEAAQSILITSNAAFGRSVMAAVETLLTELPRADTARASWGANGAIVYVNALDDAVPHIDRLAPEHLQIALDRPEPFAEKVRNAGAIFLGSYAPEAIGDYIAGPNHVLPTSRSARYASGLSVLDFMKRTTMIKAGPEALNALANDAIVLANAEGLTAHARSISIRTGK
jgi:histidinol dehydrogenase